MIEARRHDTRHCAEGDERRRELRDARLQREHLAVDARERAAQAAVVGIEYGGGFRHHHRAASTPPHRLTAALPSPYSPSMTATEIIREIDCLPPAELAEVVRHAKDLEKVRQLSPEELGVLVDQFVEATDPTKAEQLREAITQGFYGRR